MGERISALDLLYALLLSSSNDAAVALADAVSGSTPAFVRLMNARATDLGLTDTHFSSPNGLDDRGYSTARTWRSSPAPPTGARSSAASSTPRRRDIPAPFGPPRHVQNRNALLWLYSGAIGVKTGFTSAAGNCLIATAARGERSRARGGPGRGRAIVRRRGDALNYGLLEFERNVVARAGDAVGSVTVSGQDVPAVAQLDLSPLVRLDRLSSVARELRPSPGVTLPVAIGSVIGSLVATASGRVLASVPVVAGSTVAVPTPSPSPTPVEPHGDVTLRDVVLLLAALVRALLGPSL